MPRPTLPVSIISGSMSWTAGTTPSSEVLASGSNVPGRAPKNGMKSRSGLYQPEQASRPEIVVASDRQLLVSEGEHSHAALVAAGMIKPSERSEEHTSELQSLMRISYAVFCLKKKNTPLHNSKCTN